jgi:hypothetical protein
MVPEATTTQEEVTVPVRGRASFFCQLRTARAVAALYSSSTVKPP